jgi:hypothetical protein
LHGFPRGGSFIDGETGYGPADLAELFLGGGTIEFSLSKFLPTSLRDEGKRPGTHLQMVLRRLGDAPVNLPVNPPIFHGTFCGEWP